jgi:ankyrin repeat protein
VLCVQCVGARTATTALHYAAQRGHNETVERLLELGADALAGASCPPAPLLPLAYTIAY